MIMMWHRPIVTKFPPEEQKSGKLCDGARSPLLAAIFAKVVTDSTVADGLGIYFAIYPKGNFSCLASLEQKHFVPVSTVLWTTDLSVSY